MYLDIYFESIHGKEEQDNVSVYKRLVAYEQDIYNGWPQSTRNVVSIMDFKKIFTSDTRVRKLIETPEVKRYLAERAAQKKAQAAAKNVTQTTQKRTENILPDQTQIPTERYLDERRLAIQAKIKTAKQNVVKTHATQATTTEMVRRYLNPTQQHSNSPLIKIRPQPKTPNTSQTAQSQTKYTQTSIDEIFRSGDQARIAAFIASENIDVEQVMFETPKELKGKDSQFFDKESEDKTQVIIGEKVPMGELVVRVADLRKSYGKLEYEDVSEIHRLQNGDVVDFKELITSSNQKEIKHFRIVQIESVKEDKDQGYEVVCLANCAYNFDGENRLLKSTLLTFRMPSTGLKNGSNLRVYYNGAEFFTARIHGTMSVFTKDKSAFKDGFLGLTKARFKRITQ